MIESWSFILTKKESWSFKIDETLTLKKHLKMYLNFSVKKLWHLNIFKDSSRDRRESIHIQDISFHRGTKLVGCMFNVCTYFFFERNVCTNLLTKNGLYIWLEYLYHTLMSNQLKMPCRMWAKDEHSK